VDFYLPDQKIVVEVDGSLYHQKPRDNREATIQLSLGLDARIVHIPAELIAKDIHKLGRCLKLP
jgi:very-short-patch-repair endonuclease